MKKIIILALLVIALSSFNVKAEESWRTSPFYSKGKEFTLEKYKGKDVLVMLYATWCHYCEAELPNLANLRRLTSKKLVILPISVESEPDVNIERFLKSRNAGNLPVFADVTGELAESLAIRSIPSFFVISKEGDLSDRYASLSEIDYDIFKPYLRK